MKKIICFLVILILNGTTAFGYETMQANYPNSAEPYVTASGAIVMDADSGRILYAKDINQKLPMASTTKIMTSLITLEQDNLEERFVVDEKAILVPGTSMGLVKGDIVDLKTLVYGMMLPSGNDAANVAAVRIAGDKESFAQIMNEKALELGMLDTNFVTPSGLDEDNHFSTPYDMAILTREALKNQDFREISKQYTAKVEFGNPPYPRMLKNLNRLIESYQGCIGIKTGYTPNAQRCLVSAVERNGITLIVVTLNCSNDFQTHTTLYNYYFNKLLSVPIKDKIGEIFIPVVDSDKMAEGVVLENMKVTVFPHETNNLTVEKNLKPIVYAPVKKGEYLGDITVKLGEITVFESPVYAKEYISPIFREQTFIEKIQDIF